MWMWVKVLFLNERNVLVLLKLIENNHWMVQFHWQHLLTHIKQKALVDTHIKDSQYRRAWLGVGLKSTIIAPIWIYAQILFTNFVKANNCEVAALGRYVDNFAVALKCALLGANSANICIWSNISMLFAHIINLCFQNPNESNVNWPSGEGEWKGWVIRWVICTSKQWYMILIWSLPSDDSKVFPTFVSLFQFVKTFFSSNILFFFFYQQAMVYDPHLATLWWLAEWIFYARSTQWRTNFVTVYWSV